MIDLDKHGEAYLIGDVHGDPFAFYRALILTECVDVPPLRLSNSAKCHHRGRTSLEGGGSAGCRWTGGAAVVVFLGDLLDNNRHEVEETGRCAHEGSQFEILDALLSLKRQALKMGGDVVWVLGNHDVWNVSLGNRACGRYAPQKQKRHGHKAYRTCDRSGGFSHTHRHHVREYMKKAKVVAVARVSTSGSKGATHVLGLHGGLADTEALVQTFGIVPGEYEQNVRRINQVYRKAVMTGERLEELDGDRMPTWCRPTRVENPTDLRRFFGTARIVKAHDVQGTANCNVRGTRRTPRQDVMEDGELCRVDVMMSRAFEKGRKEREKEFACVKLEARRGRMYRTILRATETLDRHLEYPLYLKV